MIRIAVAEKYRDSSSWSDAVGAFEQAVKAAGGRVRPTGIAYPVMAPLPPRQGDGQVRRDERVAYGSLLTAGAYARWQLGDLQGAEVAFSQATAVLPPDSEDRYSAESALRRVRVARSFRLPRWLPHLTTAAVVALVAAATALEAVHRLSGPAWATTVLGLAVLAVASWCLPVIRTLKIGGAEFTKEVGYREEAQVVRLSLAPLTVGAPPDDSLRQTTGYLPRLQLVQVGDEVAEGPAGDSSHPATEPAPALWTVPESVPASGDGAAGPAEIIAGELRQAAERDRTAPDEADNVYRALRRASVYALGEPAGDVEGDHGTESDLLHFAVDDKVSGGEIVMLPVFTGLEPMQAALLRNPDWQTLSVLEVNGAAVADNIDSEVHIVVDPWTEGEHQFPSRAETGHEPASRPKPATGAAP